MTNKPRFTITMDPELLERVSDFKLHRRISTQSKAIQQLVQMGFQSMEGAKKPDPMTEAGLDYQERELIRIARELDPDYKALLLRLVEVAVANEGKRRRQALPDVSQG